MENKIVIPFGNYKIVAYVNFANLPAIPPELYVDICDKEDNFIQSVCVVRQSYRSCGNNKKFESDNNSVDCLVWSDPNNEDFTHDFTMGIHEGDEE